MINTPKRRRLLFANKLHREILIIVFVASLLPMLIAVICLYYLIFNITAQQMAFPEGIAYTIIPAAKIVTKILSIYLPVSIILILFLAYKITHRIVGPCDRILRELGECLKGDKKTHIQIRADDKFAPFVDKINKLLDKLYKNN